MGKPIRRWRLDDVWTGLQESYRKLNEEVFQNYNTPLQTIGAIGFSAMMQGYMAFGKEGNLLVPFRTWRNTTTAQAANELNSAARFYSLISFVRIVASITGATTFHIQGWLAKHDNIVRLDPRFVGGMR